MAYWRALHYYWSSVGKLNLNLIVTRWQLVTGDRVLAASGIRRRPETSHCLRRLTEVVALFVKGTVAGRPLSCILA